MPKQIRVLQIMGIVENGGVEAVIRNYYTFIDKESVQFDFVVHRGANQEYLKAVMKMGAKVFEVTPYSTNIFKFLKEIYNIIKMGEYDVIHSNMNTMSFFPLLAAKLAGAKIRILHNHSTGSKEEGVRNIIKTVLRPFSRMFANEYWACSELAAQWMYGENLWKAGMVTIINNAVDLTKYAFDKEVRASLRKEFALEGCFVIGHVGRFMKQKNHDFLIDIFSEVLKKKDNSRLLLIGDGPLKAEIESKVRCLKLEDKVIFLQSRNDVQKLYNVMDVFVLPSYYEGLPVVGVEAQANGLPCLCSDKVTRELIISDNIELYDIKCSASDWADKVLMKSRKQTKVAIKDNFNIKTQALKLADLYQKLVQAKLDT